MNYYHRYLQNWTAAEEEQLTLQFRKCSDFSTLALQLGRTERAVRNRAEKLGLICGRSRAPWSTEEEDLLERMSEEYSLHRLVVVWNRKARVTGWPLRTVSSLRSRIHKLQLSSEATIGCYKISALQEGLGVSYPIIMSWIKSGKLRAKKLDEEKGNTSAFLVQEKDLIKFTMSYPAEISERVTSNGYCWLLEMIAQHYQKSNSQEVSVENN